jgi:fatty acid desaturase
MPDAACGDSVQKVILQVMPFPVATEASSSAADVALPEAPAASVPADLRSFVRTERLAHPRGVRSVAHIVVVLAAWIGLVATGFALDNPVAWVAVWAALGVCTATPLALMHEAVHQNLFRSRLANHLAGTVAAAWLFFHGPAYRAWHLTHHAYTFEPEDSEQLPERFRSRLGYVGYCLLLGPTFAAILWAGAAATVAGRPPRWVGAERLRSYVRRWAIAPALVLAVAAVAASEWPSVIVRGWLIPAAIGSVVVFPFLTMPEHYEGKGRPGLLANTRTTTSNRLLRFLYWNNNLHTAHHLVPTVPPQSLGRLDGYIAERNSLRDSGFFAFHHRVLHELPWLPRRRTDAQPAPAAPVQTPPRSRGLSVTISNRVDAAHLDRLWDIYLTAFEPLRELALLNHLYTRDVFDSLVLDDRVFKIIGWVDGEPVGVAVITNSLDLVPQISPPFLYRRYPELAARDAIFFGVFICVDERSRAKSLAARLIAGMAQVAALRGGVVICDVSEYNCDRGVDRVIGRVTDWFPNATFTPIDSQHYFEALYPEPIERLPFSNTAMPDVVIDLREGSDPSADVAFSDDSSSDQADRSVPTADG